MQRRPPPKATTANRNELFVASCKPLLDSATTTRACKRPFEGVVDEMGVI